MLRYQKTLPPTTYSRHDVANVSLEDIRRDFYKYLLARIKANDLEIQIKQMDLPHDKTEVRLSGFRGD